VLKDLNADVEELDRATEELDAVLDAEELDDVIAGLVRSKRGLS